MHRFVYVSTATCSLTDHQIADIAGACHRNNRRNGLTGMLVAHQGKFLHILEGDEAAIRRRAQMIQNDPRHGEFEVIEAREIEMRAFTDWTFVTETPKALPLLGNEKTAALADLMPINSPLRGRDLSVRHMVRDFLASFKQLLAAA
ncbi:BLUF domain-containing protein [Tritonibacter horizontis]|uniref:Sensors of blue-light using FAD n=1 Tax=Tritonibacter horizontis TaxID=1768241 RepID=A0A132C1G3_9RHOB|nr:BLUF domain-containing protein [Tritonibacter horizontis]KUP94448.1 sensors of blue-light using FAD [Tritonibacter horizontis]